MADLSFAERRKMERVFQMGSGYVLDFSDRTFREFVLDATGRDIDDPRYSRNGGSKARRTRQFWEDEPNHVVAKLTQAMLDHCADWPAEGADIKLFAEI